MLVGITKKRKEKREKRKEKREKSKRSKLTLRKGSDHIHIPVVCRF